MSGTADEALWRAIEGGRALPFLFQTPRRSVGLLLGSSWSAPLSPRTHTASTSKLSGEALNYTDQCF